MLPLVKTELDISAGCQSDEDDDVLSCKHKILQAKQIHVSWLNIIGLNNNHVIQVSWHVTTKFSDSAERDRRGSKIKEKTYFRLDFILLDISLCFYNLFLFYLVLVP